jgi:hypothetical protein
MNAITSSSIATILLPTANNSGDTATAYGLLAFGQVLKLKQQLYNVLAPLQDMQ